MNAGIGPAAPFPAVGAAKKMIVNIKAMAKTIKTVLKH